MMRAMDPLETILCCATVAVLFAAQFVLAGRGLGWRHPFFVGAEVLLAGISGWIVFMALSMAFSQ